MKPRLVLLQLPVPQPAALSASGNVPLAAGALGVAARHHGLEEHIAIDVLPPEITDGLGDTQLVDFILEREPTWLGISLYLWNSERSLHIAMKVKERRPETYVIVGGPEVSADNTWVVDHPSVDVAVSGEAEETFVHLFDRLVKGDSLDGLSGCSVRAGSKMSPFAPADPPAFPLNRYPSPYITGTLPVEGHRSTYVETVRGCRSHCTFCFYPRSSANLRSLDLDDTRELMQGLRDRGAREVVFLDPTFNHRPAFEELLVVLKEVNLDRRLDYFGEVRAEGLTDAHAQALAAAGFGRVEIGLQSVSDETLRITRRHGSARLVAEAAKRLHHHGVRLLVDLIVGLPGDTQDDVRRGFEFLRQHELGSEAQVFLLSLLPGTAMRADAQNLGITFDSMPPYRIRSTPTMTLAEMAKLLSEAEDMLGRRLDELPRPHLVGLDATNPRDAILVDLDSPNGEAEATAAMPLARHAAMWVQANDLWASRSRLEEVIAARVATDPCCTLDLVLKPSSSFPLDLLEFTRSVLSKAPPSYLSRVLEHRGENAQRRLSVVLEPSVKIARDLGLAAMELAFVYRNMSLATAAENADSHGDGRPFARVTGPVDLLSLNFRTLVEQADPDAVVFEDRLSETHWTRNVLGLSER